MTPAEIRDQVRAQLEAGSLPLCDHRRRARELLAEHPGEDGAVDVVAGLLTRIEALRTQEVAR